MLSHLTVKNVALIDHVELSLQPGLTVLTGETGAGKSIVVEALLLLLGQRASADVVRTGAAEGVVEAQFHLSGATRACVDDVLRSCDLPALEDAGTLVLRRVLSREGRHKQQVNGALCTVAQLKAVAEPLVDFTGQHAHQQLLRPAAALPMLDGFAGLEADVAAMGQAFAAATSTAAELLELRTKEADKERRLDVLRFYLDEIEALDPRPGEDLTLEADRRRLMNAGKLREALADARGLLVDGEHDVLTRAQQAQAALKKAVRDDPSLQPLVSSLDEAVALIDDVARSLVRHGDVDDDPRRLLLVEDRLDALKRVMKKHGGDLDAVLVAKGALQAERALLQDAASRIGFLEARLTVDVAAAVVVAERLSAARCKSALLLAAAIASELPSLGMGGARIEVKVEASSSSSGLAGLTRTGADRVEVLFSANAGEALAPLAKVASGGELSRVLLAVKRVLLAGDPVPVSVFDEVDAGVGGAVGEAIGQKLQAIALTSGGEHRQVLCITHLAQIACRGEGHLVVEKAVSGGRTISRVRAVADEARVDELGRMLGGKEITAATLEHAREMLTRARAERAGSTSAAGALAKAKTKKKAG
ncbi:MAG: DNA repair protein RecN [Deltaproteobacteria bacterium]|nr:DNA repair protein RecN [Deltaproteobacteria bacterium]